MTASVAGVTATALAVASLKWYWIVVGACGVSGIFAFLLTALARRNIEEEESWIEDSVAARCSRRDIARRCLRELAWEGVRLMVTFDPGVEEKVKAGADLFKMRESFDLVLVRKWLRKVDAFLECAVIPSVFQRWKTAPKETFKDEIKKLVLPLLPAEHQPNFQFNPPEDDMFTTLVMPWRVLFVGRLGGDVEALEINPTWDGQFPARRRWKTP